MTLEELITDLKAAGANENTLRLAMNCYELGQKDEREALLNVVYGYAASLSWNEDFQADIRARGKA